MKLTSDLSPGEGFVYCPFLKQIEEPVYVHAKSNHNPLSL